MRLNEANGGGSFPTVLGRINLEPGAGQLGGGGSTAPIPAPSAPATSAPAPVQSDPSPSANGSVNAPSSNTGPDRSFELPDFSPGAGSPPTGQTQPQRLPTPTDPNQAAGAGALPPNFQSIREAAQEFGFTFGQDVTDDRMALQRLIHQAQANNYNAQLGARLAPHAQDIQQMLAQRNQPQQPAAPERQPWEAPPFDPRWESLVIRDPQTGMFLSKQGVDPAIGAAVSEFVDWKQKFDANPAAVINGMVKAQAREEALSIFREQSAVQQQQQAAQNIYNANSEWVFAKDASGRPITDWQGRRTPTPHGAVYLRHLASVRQAGVTDAVQMDNLARQLMAGEYAVANRGQATQQAQATGFGTQQATQQVSTNPLQALPPQQREITNGVTQPGEEGLSLMERMARNFAAGGVTDNDFSPENMRVG